ncbi:minor tail protein [Escherichia coli O55:H7 str. USDA 5905]|nr:minor tail protein [Escherichia coli O55:H7 str. USDA 5905]
MQDIHEESLNESVKSEQSPRVVLWEIDLTVQGGERYFFCNELNEKGERSPGRGGNIRHTRLTAVALR